MIRVVKAEDTTRVSTVSETVNGARPGRVQAFVPQFSKLFCDLFDTVFYVYFFTGDPPLII